MSISKITEAISPVDKTKKINEVIDAVNGITVNNSTVTFKQGDTVKGTMTTNQASNSIIELDEAGSQGGKQIGEIVTSTIPLSDAGLHLLDGSLLSGSGAYADFVSYIGNLYTNLYLVKYFCSENNWQTSVSNYGVCGKFVYTADWYAWKNADGSSDTVYYTDAIPNSPAGISQQPSLDLYYTNDITQFPTNKKLQSTDMRPHNNGTITSNGTTFYKRYAEGDLNATVRLPKITGFIEGATSIETLSNLTTAGLPNITSFFNGGRSTSSSGGDITYTGAIYKGDAYNTYAKGDYNAYNLYFDASLSNSIYGNSSTVQPQAIKVLYYIVVADTVKTEIEVDIDEIATDLNGKADTDLSNATFSTSVKNDIFGFGLPKFANRININPSGSTSGSYTTPAKGYICVDFTSYAKTMSLSIGGVTISNRTSTNSYMTSLNGIYPVNSGVTITFSNGYIASTTYSSQGIYFVPIQAN